MSDELDGLSEVLSRGFDYGAYYLTAYETCPKCKGAGLEDGLYGPVTCSECHGNCTVRIRDSRGRFATKAVDYVKSGEVRANAKPESELAQ